MLFLISFKFMITAFWDIPSRLKEKTGSLFYGLSLGLMLAALMAIFKPITGVIDFVKELVDGYIDYFTPKKLSRIDQIM